MKITLRIWILIVVLCLAILAINPTGYFTQGVQINDIAVNSSSDLAGITKGEVIKSIDGQEIKTIEEFSLAVSELDLLDLNETTRINVVTDKSDYVFLTTNNLGITVSEVPSTSLKAGLDLQGGARALVRPERKLSTREMQDLLEVIRNRLNVYGITDVTIRESTDLSGNRYVLVEMAGATTTELRDLIGEQGKFEAKIGNETVFIGGERDITFVCRNDASCAAVRQCDPSNEGYVCKFEFSVHLSEVAASRFANVTSELRENVTQAGANYLDKNIDFYLDDKLVDSLLIASDLKGKEATRVAVSGPGFGDTQAQAYQNAEVNMKKLQTVLITGSLPFKLEIVKLDSISPLLGKEFTTNIFIAALAAAIAVSIIILLRYKKAAIILPTMITVFSEIMIVLGIAALIRWNLDLASIAGIIAAIGTGVDDQILMIDESRGSKEYSIKERIKRAFRIILGAYITSTVALLPLWWAGAGLLRGFAFTTLIGITIGVFITRPAFGDMIRQIIKD
jgi:preprotein translocase subunit SecD